MALLNFPARGLDFVVVVVLILRMGVEWVASPRPCEKFDFFLSLSKLSVIHITLWFHAYSTIQLFCFSSTFVESVSGVEENYFLFIYNYLIRYVGDI